MFTDLKEKLNSLLELLKNYKRIAVAYSAGVDSTLLLKASCEALGYDNVLAITVNSGLFPNKELQESIDFCKEQGINQIVLEVNPIENEEFRKNPVNRCYICKNDMFNRIIETSKMNGFDIVCEGSNVDDLSDYRPGMKAVEELGVISPLKQVGLTKNEIRELSRRYDLPTFNKPSFACLASRIAYGEMITAEKLSMVEKAESLLHDLGLIQFRVRVHKDVARIETEVSDFEKVLNNREMIYQRLNEYGFKYVSLDLKGYRTGSMN